MAEQFSHNRDEKALAIFVERFASFLSEAGFPRMPARVFVQLLLTDSGRLTAARIAELLRISPAAVSGAVRYLGQINLVSREREPGSRRDYYCVHENVWHEAIARRDQLLARGERGLREGIALLALDSPARARLNETLEFFEFMQKELPSILEKWRAHKRASRKSSIEQPGSAGPRSAGGGSKVTGGSHVTRRSSQAHARY